MNETHFDETRPADKKFRVYFTVNQVVEKRGTQMLKRSPRNKVVFAQDARDARNKVESRFANVDASVTKAVAL